MYISSMSRSLYIRGEENQKDQKTRAVTNFSFSRIFGIDVVGVFAVDGDDGFLPSDVGLVAGPRELAAVASLLRRPARPCTGFPILPRRFRWLHVRLLRPLLHPRSACSLSLCACVLSPVDFIFAVLSLVMVAIFGAIIEESFAFLVPVLSGMHRTALSYRVGKKKSLLTTLYAIFLHLYKRPSYDSRDE